MFYIHGHGMNACNITSKYLNASIVLLECDATLIKDSFYVNKLQAFEMSSLPSQLLLLRIERLLTEFRLR